MSTHTCATCEILAKQIAEMNQAAIELGTASERENFLAEECGALQAERDDLLIENAKLRRHIDKLEGRKR